MRIGIAGLGLIGSSLARGLAGRHTVRALDPDPRATVAGVAPARDLLDLADADLVLLAAPSGVNEQLLQRLMAAGVAVPTADCGSVKGPIDAVWRTGPAFPFVGTHPMAGSERAGASAGDGTLFAGSAWPVVVAEDTDATALLRVLDVILTLGGFPMPMSAPGHDRAVALASHLPHLLAAALGAAAQPAPERALALALAAGSFRDVTRVAASPPARTAGFVTANAAPAAAAARAAAAALLAAAAALDTADAEALRAWLAPGHTLRRDYDHRRDGPVDAVRVLDAGGLRDLLIGHRDTGWRLAGVRRTGDGWQVSGEAAPG